MPRDQTDQRNQGIIIIEEERLKERFTQIPNTILRRPDVTPGAKLTYVVLLSYAWQDDSCFPGQQILAHDTGVSRRSVVTYLQELQEKGLLAVKRRGLGQTNVYTITRWDTPRSAESAHQEVKNLSHPEVQNLHANNTQVNNTQQKKTQHSIRFEENTTHKQTCNLRSKKREIANFDVQPPSVDEPRRGRRETPAPIGQILAGRTAERPLDATRNALQFDSRPVLTESGPESRPRPRTGRPQKATEQIAALIEQFSAEFHDEDHAKPNISQAARLWKQSGLSEDAFCAQLYEARSRTKQAPGIEKRASGEAGQHGLRNKMPYYFACLEDVLGLREDQAPPRTGRLTP